MARAIGFPAIGVWSDWRGGNFSFVCKKKTVSVCGRRQGGINATGMNANLEGLSSVSLSERRCIQSQIEYIGR